MRILIFSPRFFPAVGGLEILVQMLATQFCLAGHTVHVITKEQYNQPDGFLFEVLRTPSKKVFFKTYLSCDVYFMPNLSLKGVWPLMLFPFKKWVISHNNRYESVGNKKNLIDWLKLSLMFLAKNISVSRYIASQIWAKSSVIHNCYNSNVFYRKETEKLNDIVFVGRLVSDKGIEEFIRVLAYLWKKGSRLSVQIIGDGPLLKELKLFTELEIPDGSVHFRGSLPEQEVSTILCRSRLSVIPSLAEPFGIVLLESFACGCEVLISPSGALPEVALEYAYTVDPSDTRAFAGAIEQILYNVKKGNFLNKVDKMDAYLKRFLPDRIAAQYLEVFKN